MFEFLTRYFKAAAPGEQNSLTTTSQPRSKTGASRDLLDRYHQWVYVCASRNASAVAQVPLRLYATTAPTQNAVRACHRALELKELRRMRAVTKAADVVEVLEHPVLTLINNGGGYALLELTDLFLELVGDAYWYVPLDGLGLPERIQVLDPRLIRIVPGDNGAVKGYLYGVGNSPQALRVEQVVHFKMPNPRNPYYGMSPLQAVIASDDQYTRTLEYETALAENGAIPAMGIRYNGVLPIDEAKRVEADWNRALRGTAKTGKIKAYDNNWTVEKFALTPTELNYLEGRRWTRTEICGAYGVPISLIDVESVNLANALVGERTYARWTVAPRLRRMQDVLNQSLQLWYAEKRIILVWDDPVPDNDELELNRTIKLAGGGIITRDEARQLQGFAPVGGDLGGEYVPDREWNQDADLAGSDEKSFGEKPYPHEHAFRLRDPHNFDRFRRSNDEFGRGIHAIWGITADGRVYLQAIRFAASFWTYEAAKKWIRDHNYHPILSEPATDPQAKEIENSEENA